MISVSLDELNLRPLDVSSRTIAGHRLLIRADEAGQPIEVFRDKCSHMGGRLSPTRGGFVCRAHGWTYKANGENYELGKPGLVSVDFSLESGRFILQLSETRELLLEKSSLSGEESLELLAHASFFLTANQLRVLFDPWLVGPTYWGSWHHFPKNSITVEAVRPSHIVITHPHPDHFHPQSLVKFSKDTPVLIPNFESGILQDELEKIGFHNIQLVDWETELWLDESVGLAFLRPTSFWDDSAVLVRVGDWLWLNQVDAGAPLRDDLISSDLDLLSSSFDLGASGWPLTWKIPEQKKAAVMESGKGALLDLIRERCRDTGARYFAPFASWWRHGLEVHRDFANRIPHVSLDDLQSALEGERVQLIPTIPSSIINLASMKHEFDEACLTQLSGDLQLEDFVPPTLTVRPEDLITKLMTYMKELCLLSGATGCERVEFQLVVPEIGMSEIFLFGTERKDPITRISATIPGWVAELLVSGDRTAIWNHLDIGYWCEWERSPDVYPVKFMRLLQLGNPKALHSSRTAPRSEVEKVAVGGLIERDPDLTRAILSRAGLPCASCSKSSSESLMEAFEIHGVAEADRERVLNSVSALLGKS